jgi:flagellar motor switch protein FliG
MTSLLDPPNEDTLALPPAVALADAAAAVAVQSPAAPPKPDVLRGISGFRKAAILLMQLGREETSKVFGVLSDGELEELSAEIARMGDVGPDVSAAVLAEFAEMVLSGPLALRGGLEHARQLLIASVGEKRANEILDRVAEGMVDLPFSFLQQADSRQIVSYLGDEHPQTIALVLAHVPASLASQVLAGLAGDLRAEVAHRIAVMDRTTPETIRRVESALQRRLSSLLMSNELSAVGGVGPLVEIVNRADRGTERMILEGLEERDSVLAEQVRSQMFMFEDLINLDDRAIQLVVRQVETAELATALKGVSDGVRDKLLRNMSERAAQDLVEEIEVMGPVRLASVEEAQASVVRTIRSLEEGGQIVVRRGDEDEFVA